MAKFNGIQKDSKEELRTKGNISSKKKFTNNSNGSGKKKCPPLRNEKDGVSEQAGSGNETKPYNDVSFWFQNPEMARDAASVWFTSRVGTPIIGKVGITSDTYVAGVMRINFIPTFGVTGVVDSDGYSKFDTSAINQAFIKLYWDIVHANSRNITYEASDIAKYMLACSNVFMMLQDAVRVYAILNKLSVQNPYYGKILVEACGWDYDELVGKIADFRYRLNQLITLVNRLYVPAVFNIFPAHLNLINRIFADGDSVRSQLYVMVPDGYYTYNDATGEMKWLNNLNVTTSPEGRSVSHNVKGFSYLSTIEQRISEILNSEYMGVMGGDILKRYGTDAMFKFPYVDENEDLLFVRDDEFNLALENAAFIGVPVPTRTQSGPDKYEVSGHMEYTIGVPESGATQLLEIRAKYYDPGTGDLPYWKRGYRNQFDRIVINLPDDIEATPETIMLATRMWHHIEEESIPVVDPRGSVHELDSVGTIICEYCELYVVDAHGSLIVTPTAWNTDLLIDDESRLNGKAVLTAASQYHYIPRVYARANGNNMEFTDIGKVDNFGFMSISQLMRLNYVAITSIFTEVNVSTYGFPRRGNET